MNIWAVSLGFTHLNLLPVLRALRIKASAGRRCRSEPTLARGAVSSRPEGIGSSS
jgi:hypothetical protein